MAPMIEAIPSTMKNATSTIVRVSTPASGRRINIRPSITDSTAVSIDQAKPGICRECHAEAARKTPAMKKSHPAKSVTANVATLGSATARNPSTIMTMPWIRNSFQCAWIVKANWRRSSSISVWLLIVALPLLLRRQTNAARPDQAGIGRLEAPEGSACRPLQVDILIVGAAEREIGCCGVVVRYRHKTENDSARIDLDNAPKTSQCCPEVAAHVVMHAVGTAIPRHEGSGLYRTEGRMRRIFRALRAA